MKIPKVLSNIWKYVILEKLLNECCTVFKYILC